MTLPCFLNAASAADNQQAVWSHCDAAEECVIVGAGCAVAAVNRVYQTEADEYYRNKNSMMDCEPRIDPEKAGVACSHRKTACTKFWGLVIDHASTCVSAQKACSVVPSGIQ